MRAVAHTLLFALTTLGVAAQTSEERNDWPVYVEKKSPDSASLNLSSLGPFWFSQPITNSGESPAVSAHGVRPFFVATADAEGKTVSAYSFYPFFTYHAMRDGYRWSVFSLINHHEIREPAITSPQRAFDLWPFYFSVESGSPETSYHAVLPIYGVVKQRFGMDHLTWVLFPIYAKWEKNHVTTTTVPYPFIKILQGEGNHGFEFWPIAGYRAKAGAYERQFYLWPLIYKQERELWLTQPDMKSGFLPFYAHAQNAEVRSETYLWPFFGYTDRTAPFRYHQTNYLWPLLVQGRGDDHYINRWGPIYTHSIVKGAETTWWLWPLWRQQNYIDGALKHTQRQFLYFLYNDHEQSSVHNPALANAHRTNIWPLFTWWDNGAGRKQFQTLSPLEVFFPSNNAMRLSYSAFFALYRFNQLAPGHNEQTALWNLVSYRRETTSREFHLGPLFSKTTNASASRYAIGNGLIAWQRTAETGWHFSFFDFKRRETSPPNGASAP